MKFEIDYIEKLAKVLSDNSLTEISLEDGEQAITIRKELIGAPVITAAPAPAAAAPQAAAAPAPAKEEVKKVNLLLLRWLELFTQLRRLMQNRLSKSDRLLNRAMLFVSLKQ